MATTTSKAQFDVSLPDKIPKKYWANTDYGLSYVIYSLVHMSREDTSELLHAIRFHGEAGTAAYFLKVARAPIYDFCSNNKTLRDIYEYVRPNPLADDFSADEAQHTLLLDGGNHDIAPARFIVVAHQDWEDQGVLLVEFDCDPLEKGTLGVMRVDVGVLPQCLAMLQRSNVNYSDLKASELDTKWSEPIPGYTGTDWQRRGYSMQNKAQQEGRLMRITALLPKWNVNDRAITRIQLASHY